MFDLGRYAEDRCLARLIRGRERVARLWYQGFRGGHVRGHCAETAVGWGSGRVHALGLIAMVIGTEHIARWNDARERRLEDVLAAFDRAIVYRRRELGWEEALKPFNWEDLMVRSWQDGPTVPVVRGRMERVQ